MRCKVGHWKTGLGVQLDEEAFNDIRCLGRMLSVTVRHDRRLVLGGVPNGGGSLSVFGGRDPTRYHKAEGFHAQAEMPVPRVSMPQPGFFDMVPLFELHELGLTYDFAYDALLTEPLGPDHELPWPHRRLRTHRLSAEELRHQCYLRCRSHMLAGGHGYFDEVGVPSEVVRTMGGGFILARDKARAEVDMIQARVA